jgi:uncharacterized protein (DUF697 family)
MPTKTMAVTDKEQQAQKAITKYMWWSAGAGLIPIHYVDLTAVAAVQLKLLAEISKIYSVPFQENLGKAAIAALGGLVVPHAAAYRTVGSLLKQVPVIGVLAGAPAMVLFSAAYAWALGNLFVQHFESGGSLLNFNAEELKEHFRRLFERGWKIAVSLGRGAKGQPPEQPTPA